MVPPQYQISPLILIFANTINRIGIHGLTNILSPSSQHETCILANQSNDLSFTLYNTCTMCFTNNNLIILKNRLYLNFITINTSLNINPSNQTILSASAILSSSNMISSSYNLSTNILSGLTNYKNYQISLPGFYILLISIHLISSSIFQMDTSFSLLSLIILSGLTTSSSLLLLSLSNLIRVFPIQGFTNLMFSSFFSLTMFFLCYNFQKFYNVFKSQTLYGLKSINERDQHHLYSNLLSLSNNGLFFLFLSYSLKIFVYLIYNNDHGFLFHSNLPFIGKFQISFYQLSRRINFSFNRIFYSTGILFSIIFSLIYFLNWQTIYNREIKVSSSLFFLSYGSIENRLILFTINSHLNCFILLKFSNSIILQFIFLLSMECFLFISFYWGFISFIFCPHRYSSIWRILPSTSFLIIYSSSLFLSHASICGGYGFLFNSHSTFFLILVSAEKFISLQIKEYCNLGFYLNDSLFGCLFYFLTTFHFFHLVVGLILLGLYFGNYFFFQTHFYSSSGGLPFGITVQVFHILSLFSLLILYWHFIEFLWLLILTLSF